MDSHVFPCTIHGSPWNCKRREWPGRHGIVYGMAWRAWNGIWLTVWPWTAWCSIWYYLDRHGMIYGMDWRAWHCICYDWQAYGMACRTWYGIWCGWQANGMARLAWHGIWYGLAGNDQTWGQILWNVIHYITITFKVITLYYNYNYSVFEKVMYYITITSPK